jgi:hypothetical protein
VCFLCSSFDGHSDQLATLWRLRPRRHGPARSKYTRGVQLAQLVARATPMTRRRIRSDSFAISCCCVLEQS